MDLWTEDIKVRGEMESSFSGSLRVRGTATGKHFKGGRGERKKVCPPNGQGQASVPELGWRDFGLSVQGPGTPHLPTRAMSVPVSWTQRHETL